MSGPKAFGNIRLPQTLGNVGLVASIAPGGGVADIGGLAVTTSEIDTNTDPVEGGLLTASVLYAGNSEDSAILYRLTATLSIDPIPSATAPVALHTMARVVGLTDQADWQPGGASPVDNTGIGAASGAIVVMPPRQFSATNIGGDNAQASAGVTADPLFAYIAASIDATLIIQPGVDQPLVDLELVQIDGGGDTVLWSRQMGVGDAVVDALTQSVSISGLAIACAPNAGLELRFSASSVVGAAQSVALTYYQVSV